MNKGKKIKYYLILLLIFFILLELLSLGLITYINNNPLIKKSKYFFYSKEAQKLTEYKDLIPYVDDKIDFNDYIDDKTLNDKFYTTLIPFKINNKENILLQGDSWAAALNKENIYKDIIKIIDKNNYGLINAGKVSYSISPINVQFNILYKKLNLKPSKVIVIIDQTDIGDEIHRYQSLKKNSLDLTDTAVSVEFKKNFFLILDSNKLNIFKFALLSKEFWYSKLNQFDNDYLITFKYISSRFFYILTNTPTVIAPLKYGINNNQEVIIKERFKNYITNVFDKKINELIFVSHPHRGHVFESVYKINISKIIDNAINETNYKKRIIHINFQNNFDIIYKDYKKNEIFLEGDKTSHLTDQVYKEIFFPYIFNNCC